MIERILGIILPVFTIVAFGYFYARRNKPDMTHVNRLSMTVVSPALIFSVLASKSFAVGQYGPLMLGSVGVVLGSGLLAYPVARLLHVDWRTFVPSSMFNNCGNMGLPLAVLAFGDAGFPLMVALFAISNLLQFTLGTWMVAHETGLRALLRNPMVGATVLGFAFSILHPPVPAWLMTAIRITGDALVPLMLLSLGARLAQVRWSDWRIGLAGGVTCPVSGLIVASAIAPLLGLAGAQRGILIVFGCLPPAVLNFMVAEHYRQEPARVASIVLIGNMLSLVFVPIGLALALR